MKLTDEQNSVVDHEGNGLVRAVAGSGKTEALKHFCLRRAKEPILYLVYNKAMREEAARKFKKSGLTNVTIETTHSLAYRNYGVRARYRLHEKGGYRVVDLITRPEIAGKVKPDALFATAHHALGFLNYYCNSNVTKMEDLNYIETIKDAQSKQFAAANLSTILSTAYGMMKDMYQGTIPITHDAYLKLYALSGPTLEYSYILCDEAQDTSGVSLGIIMQQEWPKKILVGDDGQQLYSFRHAINSLAKVDYKSFSLTNSFRFDQRIADLAMKALRLKSMLALPGWDAKVTGLGDGKATGIRAVLARGNLSLIVQAIDDMIYGTARNPCFEGGFHTYTYLGEGGSLFDILYLYLGQHARIRDELIKSFNCFEELLEYQALTNDRELILMSQVVVKYGPALFDYIRMLRESQVPKERADTLYASTHKSKGQEYPTVSLCDDFITADKIATMQKKAAQPPAKGEKPFVIDPQQVNEEINCLYVAITRTQSTITMPFSIDEVRPDWRR